MINWEKLREEFFEECTDDWGDGTDLRKVNLTPHNLFEWFKKKIESQAKGEDVICPFCESNETQIMYAESETVCENCDKHFKS